MIVATTTSNKSAIRHTPTRDKLSSLGSNGAEHKGITYITYIKIHKSILWRSEQTEEMYKIVKNFLGHLHEREHAFHLF